MHKLVHKLFTTKASSVDDEAKTVKFVISTNEEDRYGEVVDQKSWDFGSYLKNPLVLWGHDPDQPENVLGTASSLETSKDGSETTAVLSFDTDINPNANLIFNQIKRGTLRTVSVGFINHTFNIEKDVPVLSDNELLEISVVPIPANSGAVALSLKAGEINRKDAKWLMDSMRREADLMQEQYDSQTNDKKEKSMTDEQATALIDAMAAATTAITALNEKVDAQAALIEELKPAEETEEEKTARENQEAADAAKTEADQKAADEEAARLKAEEDAKDPAKSGDDDQDGAGDAGTFNEDAEITPEEQAEIDAELEALLAA